jgi:hypothetical protein
MIKKLIIVVMMISLCSVSAVFADESTEQGEKPKFGFNMNFAIGLSSYVNNRGEQEAFQMFGIFPEFTYGKWGLGLDLTVELDGDFKLRDLDKKDPNDTTPPIADNPDNKGPDRWSTIWDYITRIHYLRYGYKGDPLYGRIGAFNSYTLGHGLIMEGFSNTLYYPQIIQLGLNFDMDGKLFDFPYIGIETVVDDILDWDIMGVRVYSRPLAGISTPIVKELKIGATIVTDVDNKELEDMAAINKRINKPVDNSASETVTEFGLDVELPILQKQDMSLIAYSDIAKISGKGTGGFVGSTFNYTGIPVLGITVTGQLRFFGQKFVPHYFDALYELERSTKYASLDSPDYDSFYMGYLIGTELGFFNIIDFFFYWSDGFTDPMGPSIQTGVGLADGALAKLDAGIMYEKKDINSFRDFFNKNQSLMQVMVGYRVSGAAKIVFIYERTYTPYSSEPTGRTMVETQISF